MLTPSTAQPKFVFKCVCAGGKESEHNVAYVAGTACIEIIHFDSLSFGGIAEIGNKGSILSSNRHFNHW